MVAVYDLLQYIFVSVVPWAQAILGKHTAIALRRVMLSTEECTLLRAEKCRGQCTVWPAMAGRSMEQRGAGAIINT